MIRSSHDIAMAGSSSESEATHELVWPCPGDPRKARFVLHDGEEVALWHFLKERGLSMESSLVQTKAKLKEALERVELIHQAVSVGLPHVAKVSLLCFWCLSSTPWSSVGCVSVLASHFTGVRGKVDPQVPFPLGETRSDGAGSNDVAVG